MIPVMQTIMYQDSPRVYGDCTRACIASILELSISEVPHFLEIAQGDAYEYHDLIEGFLMTRGYAVLWQHDLAYHWKSGDPSVYHLMSGPSPRAAGIYHSVVGRNGVPYFDPHPSGAMLAGPKESWTCSFILKV